MSIKIAIWFWSYWAQCIACVSPALSEAGTEIVAVNDLADIDSLIHLLTYDSVHGVLMLISVLRAIPHLLTESQCSFSRKRSGSLPWADLGIDVVHECTGLFANKAAATQHLEAGAKKVLISAPAGTDVDATIVYGVNHDQLQPSDTVISNASVLLTV